MTIIKLETDLQDQACNEINHLYDLAIANGGGSVYARNVIKKCYDDSWNEIKKKMETEGSVWYVWYMDGVNRYIQRHFIRRRYYKRCRINN